MFDLKNTCGLLRLDLRIFGKLKAKVRRFLYKLIFL